jgi:hypothetical protein
MRSTLLGEASTVWERPKVLFQAISRKDVVAQLIALDTRITMDLRKEE